MRDNAPSPAEITGEGKTPAPRFSFRSSGEQTAVLALSGAWTMDHTDLPEVVGELDQFCRKYRVEHLQFDTRNLHAWDSRLITVLLCLEEACHQRGIVFDLIGLPAGAMRLVDLATARPPAEKTVKEPQSGFVVEAVGRGILVLIRDALDFLDFLGQSSKASLMFLLGRSSFRKKDLWILIRESGVQALHIVALVNLLVGLILAFVGAVQLRQFGAQIYVANLVTVSVIREMAPIMTGIIMAGRTGSAYAAHLGTMNLNEEIDALRTLGLSPVEFLVVPRIVALIFMMPLLCLYADFMGILGGLAVGVGMLDLPLDQFVREAGMTFRFVDMGVGLFKSVLFGFLVGLSGCFQGIRAERNAAAVGLAATSAVVAAIVAIIATDGIVAVLCNLMGI
jgi:phospholipid/cholesterol/gamma-HCH transport system permease protein